MLLSGDLYLPEVLQGLLTVQYQRFESLFKRMPNADDFIIYNTVGGVMDPDHLSSYWGDVLDGLGLPHVRFHDIRHTFATRAIEAGMQPQVLKTILGHSSLAMTMDLYSHVLPDTKAEEMQKIISMFDRGQLKTLLFCSLAYPLSYPQWHNTW